MRVRPCHGYVVRDPDRSMTPLPKEGAEVRPTTHWMRRLAKGDVELVPPGEVVEQALADRAEVTE